MGLPPPTPQSEGDSEEGDGGIDGGWHDQRRKGEKGLTLGDPGCPRGRPFVYRKSPSTTRSPSEASPVPSNSNAPRSTAAAGPSVPLSTPGKRQGDPGHGHGHGHGRTQMPELLQGEAGSGTGSGSEGIRPVPRGLQTPPMRPHRKAILTMTPLGGTPTTVGSTGQQSDEPSPSTVVAGQPLKTTPSSAAAAAEEGGEVVQEGHVQRKEVPKGRPMVGSAGPHPSLLCTPPRMVSIMTNTPATMWVPRSSRVGRVPKKKRRRKRRRRSANEGPAEDAPDHGSVNVAGEEEWKGGALDGGEGGEEMVTVKGKAEGGGNGVAGKGGIEGTWSGGSGGGGSSLTTSPSQSVMTSSPE
ncbi:unnamed protein product [Discosporangium mesarthrocarpum]